MAAGLLTAAQARAVRQPVLQPIHMWGRGRPAGSMQRLRMTFRQGMCESNQRPQPGSCLPGSERGCKQQHRQAVHLFMTEDARAACCRVALEPPSAAGRLGCEAAPSVRSPRDPRCTGRQTFRKCRTCPSHISQRHTLQPVDDLSGGTGLSGCMVPGAGAVSAAPVPGS